MQPSQSGPRSKLITHPWLSLFFMQRIHKATEGLPTLKLDVMVSCVGHAFQTCHVF